MSLRNLVKTRTYRERAQPSAREHLGLLEKKKDYVLRAKDFHRKEDALKSLREKASFRNPEEYYFGMANTKVQDGVHQKKAAAQHSFDELRAFKKEDEGYLAAKHASEAHKIERLQSSLHMLDAPLQNKHTIFADDDEDAHALDPASRGKTPAEAASVPPVRKHKKRHLASGKGQDVQQQEEGETLDEARVSSSGGGGTKLKKAARLKLEKARARQYSELEQRRERHRKMGTTLQRIGIEKALMGKGARRKIKKGGDGAPRQFKWKQRRSK
jgi:U3 small nucleolar RNA-associated protein 11